MKHQLPAQRKKKERLSPLEQAQARFNKLLQQIASEERMQQQLTADNDRYHQLYQQKILPLLRNYANEKLLLVQTFDVILAAGKWSRNQRKTYLQWVVRTLHEAASYNEEAAALLPVRVAELEALTPKQRRAAKDTGAIRQTEHAEQEDRDEYADWNDEGADWHYSETGTTAGTGQWPTNEYAAPKSPDELGSLYKELAKRIHPDLEPDEARKAEKHELMQQLTEARKQGDLYTLLRIRAQLDGGSEPTFSWPLEQLQRYNKLLQQKLRQLQQLAARALVGSMAGLQPLTPGENPDNVINSEVRQIKKVIRGIREDRVRIGSRAHLEQLLEALEQAED